MFSFYEYFCNQDTSAFLFLYCNELILLFQKIAQEDWGRRGGGWTIALTGVCVCQNVLATAMLLILLLQQLDTKHTQGTVPQKQSAPILSCPPSFTNQRLSHLTALSALLS